MKNIYKFSYLTLAVNMVLFTSVAYANDVEPVPEGTLPAITIVADIDNYTADSESNATGLDLDFKETPKTTTVVTEQRLKDQQISDIASVVKNTPGLSTLNFDGGRTNFFARGFAMDDFEVDGLPVKYGVYIDGPEFGSTAIYEQADVVRGANGLMSGSGDPSATINLIRKHADSSEFSGEVSLNTDKFHTHGAMVDVGSKLTANGKIRGRVVLDYSKGDTYVDRESKDRKTAYAVIDADITNDTLLSVGASHKDSLRDATMWGGLPMYYTDGKKTDWDVNDSTGVDWESWDEETTDYFASIEHRFNDDWKLKLNANHAKTDGDLKLFSSYGALDRKTGSIDQYSIYWRTESKNTNVAGELSGNFELLNRTHQIAFGANYNKHESSAIGADDLSQNPVTGLERWNGRYPEPKWSEFSPQLKEETKENAIYASTKLQLSEPLSLILGSRVSNFSSKGDNYGDAYDIEHNSVWTPFAGLTYDINNNVSVYGSYTDVFKQQQERNVKGDYLDPITGSNIEVGVKATNDNDTLQTQFSIFKIKQDNLAQEDVGKLVPGTADPDEDWPGDQAYYEAEGATSIGVDFEVSGKLTNDLTASIGYTHFNAEDKDGKAVNTKNPDTLLKVFATYDMNDYIPGLTLGGGVNWSNERYAMVENPATGLQEKYSTDAFTNVNLMAKYEVNNNLAVQLNVENLLDQQRVQSFEYDSITFAEPVNVKGKITYRW